MLFKRTPPLLAILVVLALQKAIASLRSLKAAEEAAGATIARPRDCDAVIASVKDILRELAAARESWWKPEYLEANPAVVSAPVLHSAILSGVL